MFELLKAGGWLMIPILVCSVVALAICVDRYWTLKPGKVAPPNLLAQVWGWIKNNQLDAAKMKQLRQSSPLGHILATGLSNSRHGRDVMKESIEEAAGHVVHDMERYIDTLGTIAIISPLLGLLGTVIGMIKVFSEIMIQGTGNADVLAGGISEALITTATGLCVAIPAMIMFRYFNRRIDGIVVNMEQETIKLVDALHSERKVDYKEKPPQVKFKRQVKSQLDINLTPLIDVVFLLLIFFMVTTTFTKETRLTVDLPEAQGVAQEEQDQQVEITISAQGSFSVNGKALVNNEADILKAALIEVSDGDSSLPLVITADAQTPHQAVVTAMDVAGQLRFVHLSITTQVPAEDS